MTNLAKVGLIGLGTMGENLALNMERNGYPVAIWDRTFSKNQNFVNGKGKGKQLFAYEDVKSFIAGIERPRKIVLLVKAGDPVDQTIERLKPFLEKGDIIIDGGNSHYVDTVRREKALREQGLFLIGSGVSGGSDGALWGPSLMPGGDKQAYESVRPIWEAIAAKVNDGPCVTYLGPDGAGHFVKMVHNGIEYGDMQLIAETYDILSRGAGLKASELAEVFSKWNEGPLQSFLIEITSMIFRVEDEDAHKPLVDLVMDKAGQKGTGKWTSEAGFELGVPAPTIDAALSARLLSALKDERVAAEKSGEDRSHARFKGDIKELIKCLELALLSSRICTYAQGLNVIAAGSKEYNWNINLSEVARIWKGGCIIRAKLLDHISISYRNNPSLINLMLEPELADMLRQALPTWRHVIAQAMDLGIPTPALSASLNYYTGYHTARLPQNLIQAQRDCFGAHTYERMDKPELGAVHSDWERLAEKAKAPVK
jgi:6-phosphogluconate dehydrogenase